MAQKRGKADNVIHGRLVNWARAMSSPPPGYVQGAYDPEPGRVVDELDADVVEKALIRMQRIRATHYKFVWWRYMGDLSDYSIAKKARISIPSVKVRFRLIFAWLDGALQHQIDAPEG